jgi:preprotein translocase subunit SecG
MAAIDSPFTTKLDVTAGGAYDGTAPEATFAGTVHDILSAVFGVLGVIFLVLILYAGILWMTAQGDPKKVQKAKDILVQSVIGLVICLAAYGITTWVFTRALVIAI